MRSIGLTQGETFTLTALHPRPGPVGFGRYGDTVSIPMEGASALVLEIAPSRPKLPLLLYPSGNVSLNGNALAVTNVSGPIGHDTRLAVRCSRRQAHHGRDGQRRLRPLHPRRRHGDGPCPLCRNTL